MRKSQLYSQVFIYVLSIVLISFILVYGYNAVHNFKKRAEQVSCLKLKNDLRNAVESIISDFGSIKRKDLQLCAGYTQACFVETFKQLKDIKYPKFNINPDDPIIKDRIASGEWKNVFLLDNIAKESFYIGNISIDAGFDVLCLNASNNKISLRLEGKGDNVLLSEWK